MAPLSPWLTSVSNTTATLDSGIAKIGKRIRQHFRLSKEAARVFFHVSRPLPSQEDAELGRPRKLISVHAFCNNQPKQETIEVRPHSWKLAWSESFEPWSDPFRSLKLKLYGEGKERLHHIIHVYEVSASRGTFLAC